VRRAALVLIGVIGAANAVALGLLVRYLLDGGRATRSELLVAARAVNLLG
jgi:hypothetical protein